MLLSKLRSLHESLNLICHANHVCRVQTPSYAACYCPYDQSCCLLLYLEHQSSIQRHTCLTLLSHLGRLRPKRAHLSSIQGRVDWYSCCLLVPRQMISNDQLELLYKIRTPKLREWGTNCLGQIPYFLFYPPSGTAGSMPQPFLIRVRRHGPPRGFNMMTSSKGLPQVPIQQHKRLKLYVRYGPSHGTSNR